MFGCPTSLLMNKHLKENWVVFVIYCGFIYALCHYCVYCCVVLISYEECMVLWAATASICFFFVDNDPHPMRVHEVLINILHCMMLVHTICEFAVRIDV